MLLVLLWSVVLIFLLGGVPAAAKRNASRRLFWQGSDPQIQLLRPHWPICREVRPAGGRVRCRVPWSSSAEAAGVARSRGRRHPSRVESGDSAKWMGWSTSCLGLATVAKRQSLSACSGPCGIMNSFRGSSPASGKPRWHRWRWHR